ncbi:MAG TPA: hypothetical protein VLB86_03180 [Gaiellaceae bacterium]|nr:hypothetical protein [Gaiellaceae bacterium]
MRRIAAAAALVSACALAGPAQASELIDRNAGGVRLAVNAQGRALLTYRAGGRVRRVLAWGAVNAIPPTRGRRQVEFRLDYSGGSRSARRRVWIGFRNACGPYDGPPLPWLVTACKARDGSYWAVQSWQRMLPGRGERATLGQRAWELRLAHWTGELPQLEVNLNWAYRRYDHLFGRFTYRGRPVFGFRVTPRGSPLDSFGRNLYLDTLDSAYGPGWRRESAFLTHNGSGAFCYGLFPHGNRPSGMGKRYRATIIGPGVTPDVVWEGNAPGPYNRELDAQANERIRALGSKQCRPN